MGQVNTQQKKTIISTVLLRAMIRNARMVVGYRNFSSRNISTQAMDPFAEHMTKYYKGYSVAFAFVSAYTVGGFFILRNQLSPIERIMTETKQSIEKLSKEIKERTDKLDMKLEMKLDVLSKETKERTDKLEMKLDMKFDVLSKEIKESNDKINSRVDSVLLRSLDLQRGAKPASE